MHLEQRINLLVDLGKYITSENNSWQQAKQKAHNENGWFTPEFINLAIKNIADHYLDKDKLQSWIAQYQIPYENNQPKNVGIVMAGNIPLVGFHDFLSVFIAGHRQTIKPSSKDNVLIRQIAQYLYTLDEAASQYISFSEMLKGCDAYIATGSNNSARYFDYYFGKYPNLIRRNRTSVAVLKGNESKKELESLADDIYFYFGMGCRNVTKLYVPRNYDFTPLLDACGKFNYLSDHNKYKNNYDYRLALLILDKKYYMTNGSVTLIEEPSLFSPISLLHFEYYDDERALADFLRASQDIQCIVGDGYIPFGQAQYPNLTDFADRIDTLQFLLNLNV